MRADRLLSILLLLQNRGKISSRELAETLEVSERTIFRDMEALGIAGIPVLAERGREGGWMLAEGYRTSLTGMTPKEISALLLPADPAILQALGIQSEFSSASRKLQAASARLPASPLSVLNERIHIDGAGWHPSGETYPCLTALQEAVWEEHKVRIGYLRGEEYAERLICPLGLVVKRGVWYVAAETGEGMRTYRISRINSAEVMEETFRRPANFNLADYWEASTTAFKSSLPRYPAELLVKENAMNALQKERYVNILQQTPDARPGWIVVQAEFNTPESACRIILSLSPGIIVASPAELAGSVECSLREALLLYENNTQPHSF
ncbi:WYL domain-containing protein [Paenibacillus sp. MMS20-IR301]|uniref:helix-turn-helix transcriptional regulator n=1 Tax=Paenibacillus sp. MMS20-IR301 TaxID=2895946 RepID=UPI0028EA1622|nr:WYL domain-containing protein [Paenibacillus sp. MMS20-IR301]WNS44461.1 WYL domain-containing protein [Paenibacillus sp. MMS20-IR301]